MITPSMPSPRRSGERFRRQLVNELRQRGVIRSRAVDDAFRAVPREAYLPTVAAEQGVARIYRDEAIAIKRDVGGMPLSCSTQPALMAEMLELLDVRPGDRVLETGTGTGYNAALLAHIVGTAGRVTTIDLDAQPARQARRALRDGGYRVAVKVGDGRA